MESQQPISLEDVKNSLSGYLEQFRTWSFDLAKADGGNMYPADMMIQPILNRGIKLISGFLALMDINNFLCAIPLIRFQLDNALRYYATYLVDTPERLVLDWAGGTAIGKMKDRDNQKMTDTYLASKLDSIFPGVKTLYANTSGYVHLSESHFYAIMAKHGKNKGRIVMGSTEDLFSNDEQINFSFQMAETSKLVLLLLEDWKNQKERKGPPLP